MEVDNKTTTTEVITDETKVETNSSEIVQKSEKDVGVTNEKTSQSTVNNKTDAETTEEANSTISPIYSRWKSFSLSKVIENVKKQSETVKEVYQKDLSELVTTITTESQNLKKKINDMAKKPENEVASVETEVPKENEVEKEPERISLRAKRNSSIINKMSAGINSLLNKNKPEAPQKKKKIFDRKEALINELQDDPLTYLIDPLYDPESSIERIQEYKKFTQKFDLFSYHVEIDKLLDQVEEVKYHHTTIVPVRLPEEIFWQRYFFKLKELEESEELKKQLVKDVAANINEEEEIKWDSDSDDDDDKPTDVKKDDSSTPKDKINNTAPTTNTITTAATATDDKKTEDTDDDWDNWE
jgi:hypothetical protein